MLQNYTAGVCANASCEANGFQISHKYECRQLIKLNSEPNLLKITVIRQLGRQIVERSLSHIHSEEYKPRCRVMRSMIDVFKVNECTFR